MIRERTYRFKHFGFRLSDCGFEIELVASVTIERLDQRRRPQAELAMRFKSQIGNWQSAM